MNRAVPPPIAALAERLGYRFADPGLLERAMCHRSWCAENPGHDANERLEFLGDAVLGLVVTTHVFDTYPDQDEGWLSRARSSVVRASALADMATSMDVGSALRLGKGEAASGGREKTSILADALEAVIGAVYIDGGWPAAEALVLGLVHGRICDQPGSRGDTDHKSALQELLSGQSDARPRYQVDESGPEHAKTFQVSVDVAGVPLGSGVARTKKEAEQLAAEEALARLHDDDQLLAALTSADTTPPPGDAPDA